MKNFPSSISIREVLSSDDPAWDSWLDLYFNNFPFDERLRVEHYLNLFQRIKNGEQTNEHILVLEQPLPEGGILLPNVIGMAFIEIEPVLGVSFLWYIATKPAVRNQGYGAILYDYILETLKKLQSRIMIIEVEIPETSEEPDNAKRRINWYKRLGAQKIEGIQYFQVIDQEIPAKEMWLMVHPFQEMTIEEIFGLAKNYFGTYLNEKGMVELV
ncbi:MAG TPA: GNAT family N-acetyltransferase [Cyclobacteriaceae bacterium]|nr:GNAT family N-acetyltransferase [Cyclobacteriaceae bacterium]